MTAAGSPQALPGANTEPARSKPTTMKTAGADARISGLIIRMTSCDNGFRMASSQPGQAESGDAPEVRRWIVALVNKVTAIGLESVVDPVPGVTDVHVPNHVGLR
jgi:hypothetical protein